MREEDHEQKEVTEAEYLDLTAAYIDQQSNLLECVERNPKWQQDRCYFKVRAGQRIDGREEVVGIFVIAEQAPDRLQSR